MRWIAFCVDGRARKLLGKRWTSSVRLVFGQTDLEIAEGEIKPPRIWPGPHAMSYQSMPALLTCHGITIRVVCFVAGFQQEQ